MRIIVLVQLNMLAWLHKVSLPGHPEAVMMLLETYQSSLGTNYIVTTTIAVCQLLKIGMQTPDIISSKNN